MIKKEKFYKDGKLKSITFYDSKNRRHDLHKEFLPDGYLKKKCYYKNGKLHGDYEEFEDNTRKLIKKCYYKHGKLIAFEEMVGNELHSVIVEPGAGSYQIFTSVKD